MRIVNVIFLLLGLFISCQSPKDKAREEEKFRWNAGISAPKFYPSASFVEFLDQDKSAVVQTEGEIEYIRIVHDKGQEYFKF